MPTAASAPPVKTFNGWVARDAKSALQYTTFEPKPFTATDIELRITHCGICGSDIHTLRSGWGPTDYPCVVGHEIVGIVERIGAGVPTLSSSPASASIRVGDRVGIGAQSGACLRAECEACADGEESYCPRITGTYNGRYADKSKSYGGYAERWRGPAHFAFKIPDGLPSAEVAPLLCGGVTVYAPLKKYGVGPGKTALGADKVVAISRSSSKKKDAVEGLGADLFIATAEDKKWGRTYERTLDVIVCTVSGPNMPFAQYLRLLKRNGTFVQVGAPEDALPALPAYSLIQKGVKVTGSNIGSPEDIRQMLKLAAEKRVLPWVQKRAMSDVNQALEDFEAGKPRYRFVLQNGKSARL
ncbi:8-hydroxygeraniol dehydrogenase [Penicillium chermesinum]|nr:8-hydroxygeraniol dehydrogenase [Penicillium chermesinum]